jgi:hypothetical protein
MTVWGSLTENQERGGGHIYPIWSPFVLPVLPSRSALSDLGLIADLFEKMPRNWSSFCLKSPLLAQKIQKSLIFNVLAFHKNQKHRENRKTLPREHLIGCQGVKMFLLKEYLKKKFFIN